MAARFAEPVIPTADASQPARLTLLLTGAYAWLATVGAPSWFSSTRPLPRVTSTLAALWFAGALLAAPLDRRTGRLLCGAGFLGFSAVTWVALGPDLAPDKLDPVWGALGAAGWALFALAWGAVRIPRAVPEEDPHALPGDVLKAHGRLSRLSLLVPTLAVVAVLILSWQAWQVRSLDRALLVHTVAIACGVALVAGGAELAMRLGRGRIRGGSGSRLGVVAEPLVIVAIVTAFWLLLWSFEQ